MSYVLNPKGRSRRHGCGGCSSCSGGCSGCSGGCSGCSGGCSSNCGGCSGCGSGCGCHHHHHHRCGCARAESTLVSPAIYTTGDCGCPDGCPPPCPRNVIYTGPCPPGPDCPCQPPLPPPPPDPPCYRPVPCVTSHAYFAQTGTLSVSEPNGVIELDSVSDISSGSFELDGGVITINRPGTYLATFTMSLPAQSSANSRISMLLDSETLPGSVVPLVKTPGSPGSLVSQAVFSVNCAGSEFAVISSRPFTITAPSPCDTIATLAITQISGGLFPATNAV